MPGSGLETSSVNPHDIKTVQVHAFHATEVDAVVPRIVDGFVKRMTAANSTEIMIDQMIAELILRQETGALECDQVVRRDVTGRHHGALFRADRTVAAAAAGDGRAAKAEVHPAADAPREPGWDVRNVAAALTALMHSLGYARYGVQGGDLGSLVSSYAGILDPDGVCGAHLNLVFSSGTDDVEDAREHGVVAGPVAFVPDYIDSICCAQILGRAPDSFGYALNDSPAGLAALVVHAFQQWRDHDGDLQAAVDVDELLTNIMIYWVTESMPSSLRLFWEMLASGRFGPPETRVEVPTGAAQFRDICMPQREWAERHYNIVHWNEFQTGGHFAGLEQPEALVADIREFFRPLR